MACNTCVEGTPVCPYCWSTDIAPDPLKVPTCKCAACNRNFFRPYCLTDETAAALANGTMSPPLPA